MNSKKTSKLLVALQVGLMVLLAGAAPVSAANCTASISGPCTIASAGNYTLTANVSGGAGVDALPTTGNDVTLNLNGWKLVGGSTSGAGVNGCSSSCVTNTTVTNGHVFNSGAYGINLGQTIGDVDNVQATSNGDAGIWPANQSIIYHNIAAANANYGIKNGTYVVIQRNVAALNTNAIGISTNLGSGVVAESTANANTGTGNHGIDVGTGTGYARNVTGGNGAAGCNGGQSMGENLCN